MPIPFSKRSLPLSSARYVRQAIRMGRLTGKGTFTRLCHRFFEEQFGFPKVLLTHSCADAFEMSAILAGIGPGDRVILPSFASVSTANPFLLRGATLDFCDIQEEIPTLDPSGIEQLLTPGTRAIVATHYSGLACEMDQIMSLAEREHLLVIEDARHAMEAYFKDEPLGSIGHLGVFSFQDGENIVAGQGGMLAINHPPLLERAEIIWDNGTQCTADDSGQDGPAEWVDLGSSFFPSEATAALLYSQVKRFRKIQRRRKWIWWEYHERLAPLEEKGLLRRPAIPRYGTVNGNMFFLTLPGREQRDALLNHLNRQGIQAALHYRPLHTAPFFREKHDGRMLPNTQRFADTLLRLPFYYSLGIREITLIVKKITEFFSP